MQLQSEMSSMQCRTRDMMVCQGAEVSGAAVSLNNVSSRLRALIAKLVQDYSITEADMEVQWRLTFPVHILFIFIFIFVGFRILIPQLWKGTNPVIFCRRQASCIRKGTMVADFLPVKEYKGNLDRLFCVSNQNGWAITVTQSSTALCTVSKLQGMS